MLLTSLQSRASRTRHAKRRRTEQGDGLKAVQQGVAGPGRPDETVERFAYTKCDTFGFKERHGLGAAECSRAFFFISPREEPIRTLITSGFMTSAGRCRTGCRAVRHAA